jgi:hypothetical protein
VVLYEYGLQLQHLNPNNIQQMSVFEAMCKGYLGISAHLHLFKYFFMFACLRDGSKAVTIGCANHWMKQGRGDSYIPSSLTSSNSGWHKGWFYLRNDPEFALSAFTGNSIGQARRNSTDGPPKAEQEKLLKDHWAVLDRLRGAGVTLATVIGQYHARGVVQLQRRPLHLCKMTTGMAPWAEIVIALVLPSLEEIQRRVALAIRKSNFSWPPARLLPMLPKEGIEKLVSCSFFRQVLRKIGFFGLVSIFSETSTDC